MSKSSRSKTSSNAADSSGIVFVTVGSTGFDALVGRVVSPAFRAALAAAGFRKLVVQYGRSAALFNQSSTEQSTGEDEQQQQRQQQQVDVSGYEYKPSIAEDISSAQLVISHGGSGSIFETLRLGRPLIVVTNPDLADDHQTELATALDAKNQLVATTCDGLVDAVAAGKYKSLTAFPDANPKLFASIVDAELGFA